MLPFRSGPLLVTTALGALLAPALRAQDLRDVQPEPAPAMPAPPAEPAPAAPPPLDAIAGGIGAAQKLRLSGLVLLSESSQIAENGWSASALPADRIDSARLPWLSHTELVRVLGPALDQPFGDQLLHAIPASLGQLCQAAGRPFVSVIIPPQDFTSGVLQILVIEGRLGALAVEGENHFSEKSYLAAIHVRPGEPIESARLERDLAAIADNPFRQATVAARPGATVGTTDLVIQANDRRPWRFYGGYDDTGNRTTGLERVNAGVNWGNVLGLAHQLNYQLTASPDYQRSVSHSVNYVAPMPWDVAQTLTASCSYGRIRPDMPPPFDQEGHSENASLRYRLPLAPFAGVGHALSFGADYKMSDNNLEFSSIPVSGNITHIWQGSLAWEASRPDRHGATQLAVTGVFSPGDLDSDNDDDSFNATRAFAEARYAYLNANLVRSTRLPADFVLVITAIGQISDGNLLGSEQFTLGGAYTVRGYDDGDTYGDWGALLRNELQLPALRGLSRWFARLPADQFTPVVFLDAGVAGPADPLPGEDESVTLASAGAGFRYAIGAHGSLRADYGWQLEDSPSGIPEDGRIHVSATLSF